MLVLVTIIPISLSSCAGKPAASRPTAIPTIAPTAPPTNDSTASISAQPSTPGVNNTGLPLTVPAGFTLSTYTKNLGNPRVIIVDSANTALVSIPAQGKVVAIKDGGEQQKVLIDKLNAPHGLALYCEDLCQLYVAETNGVTQFQYNPETVSVSNKTKILDLPTGGRHTTRSLLIKKTETGRKLLISIGSACDVCVEKDTRRGTVMVADLDGKNARAYATGLRNSVFMIEQPGSNKVWATEMGRDFLGDDLPPDEINILEDGKNYGWPLCYGKNVHDTDFDKKIDVNNPCKEPAYTPAHIDLQAHSAPLGLAFTPDQWPQQFKDNVLVSYHGSWNRSQATGYKVVRFSLDQQGNYQSREDFITGWLDKEGKSIGRPVDLRTDNKGNVLISDDKLGNIYKLSVTQ